MKSDIACAVPGTGGSMNSPKPLGRALRELDWRGKLRRGCHTVATYNGSSLFDSKMTSSASSDSNSSNQVFVDMSSSLRVLSQEITLYLKAPR